MRTSSSLAFSASAVSALALLAALGTAAPSRAQLGDRALLNTGGGGDPYVMILFDTSGSMAWGTECTAEDRAANLCNHDCPNPNCPLPMNGDDPNSKIYQAKQVFYEEMYTIDGVRWGFASLNQDELAVGVKHWLYEVTASTGSSSVAIPAVGWQEVFGAQTGGSGNTAFNMTCDRNGGGNSSTNGHELYEMGCYMTPDDAPDINETDVWTLEKLRRLPKGGAIENPVAVSYFMRPSSGGANRDYYRITYASPIVDYATTDTFVVTVTIQSCATPNADALACDSGFASVDTRSITYEKVGEFLWWEGTVSSDTSSNTAYTKDAYFGGRTDGEPSTSGGLAYASATYADKTCRGWDPSGDEWGQQGPGVFTDVDPHTEQATSYNLRFPTTGSNYTATDPTEQWLFERGDVLPLDWEEANEAANLDAVLKRFNPMHGIVAYDSSDPDLFAQSPYFADSYDTGETFLRLKTEDDAATTGVDEAIRPLVAHGSTPLAGWFSMFRHWYSGCGKPGNCSDEFTGWSDIAAQFDPQFACTAKYVLMITDGAETCDGSRQDNAEDYYADNFEEFADGFSSTADQCRYRASLSSQEDIDTLVIGFGTENKAKLQCANTPVYFANNVAELRALLKELLGQIKESAAAFASAAVPTVQANILDKVYLSSFVPLNEVPVWPGRLDSFLKPLPLENNLPDRSAACGTTLTAECFAFDAGDSQPAWNSGTPESGYTPDGLLLQAPIESDIDDYATTGLFDSSTLQLGDGEEQRRVYFGLPEPTSQKNRRMLFDFPADPADADITTTEDIEPDDLTNYEAAFEISPIAGTVPARRAEVADIVKYTLQEKQAQIDFFCTAGNVGATCTGANADCDSSLNAGDGVCAVDAKIQYVMGDIFHSNPLVLNPPADFELFTKDLYWPNDVTDSDPGSGLCGDSAVDTVLRGSQISYAWYSNKNLCRRVSMFVGTNEGQLHAFDGGLFGPEGGVSPECRLYFAQSANDADLSDKPGPPNNGGAGGPDIANSVDGEYDFGTGHELFSFIPDFMMPLTKQLQGMAATCSAGAAALIGSICDADSECGESSAGANDGACTGGSTLTTQWGVDGTPQAVDVFVDPYVAPGGAADCRQRVWRTLLLSNFREGGEGLFALDITQPDKFDNENVPVPINGSKDYVPSCSTVDNSTVGCDTFCRQQAGNVDTDCADLAYPALRWEFRDHDADGFDDTGGVGDACDNQGEPADDDCNGEADLAETWSRPFVARLPFCDGTCDLADPAEPEDRFVAIFGGGISESPLNTSLETVGNWLYMVDIETGKVIYKRGGTGTTSPVAGSVPADITGVDEDSDGYIDTLFFGTTAGFVYKVDLSLAASEKGYELDADGIWSDPSGDDGRFDPFQVFSTEGKPIYLEIGAVYVPRKRANAILFGTGNRSNLWFEDNHEGRFYAMIDDGDEWTDANRDGLADGGVLVEANFPEVDPDTGVVDGAIVDPDLLYGATDVNGNLLYKPGWFFRLGENEKLITEPFTLTGITFFTIYDPLVVEGNNATCAKSGESKIFTINTVTTEGYAIAAGATVRTRYITAPTFTTQPYVEYSATKNPGAENSGTDNADAWTDELAQINKELRRLFPSGCKFANYSLDIKTIRSDTGVVFIAPVPMCIEPHNWKEF